MKPAVLILSLLLSLQVLPQDCKQFLLLQKNKTIEMSIYNKKGDIAARKVYQVSDVSTSGGTTTGNIATEMFDSKGRSIAKANSTIQCNGGVMMMDMKMLLPQQQ